MTSLDRNDTLPRALAAARQRQAAAGERAALGSDLDRALVRLGQSQDRINWIEAAERWGKLPAFLDDDPGVVEQRCTDLSVIENHIFRNDLRSLRRKGSSGRGLVNWHKAIQKLEDDRAKDQEAPATERDVRPRWFLYPSAPADPAIVTFDLAQARDWASSGQRVSGPGFEEAGRLGRLSEPDEDGRQYELDEAGERLHEAGGCKYWGERSGLGRLVDLIACLAVALTMNGNDWGGRL